MRYRRKHRIGFFETTWPLWAVLSAAVVTAFLFSACSNVPIDKGLRSQEQLVYVLLYATPGKLPTYVSVWQDKTACEKKADALAEYFNANNHPDYGLFCVREALRDTVKPDNDKF